jgi:hypothetical protein
LEFATKLVSGGPGGAWTCVRLTPEQRRAVGQRGNVAVKGSINGFAIRATLAPVGDGTHQLVVNRQMRDGAEVEIGDEVHVVLELDTASREVQEPDDFQRALQKNAAARRRFESLPPSHRRAYVEAIDEAKKADTWKRRIAGAVSQLAAEFGSR